MPGNLALSRALGDFVFKRNDKKPAEEQIVTGNLFNTIWDFHKDMSINMLFIAVTWKSLQLSSLKYD